MRGFGGGTSMRVFTFCPSFHSATLLSILLHRHPEVACLGDTVPTRAFDQRCPCGEHVSTCAYWQAMRRDLNTDRFARCQSMLPLRPVVFNARWPNIAVNLVAGGAARVLGRSVWRMVPGEREFRESYEGFRAWVLERKGASVFVDGQKSLSKAFLLRTMMDRRVPFKAIHLVRDPRGFANSYFKYIGEDLRGASRMWRRQHRAIDGVCRWAMGADVLLVRYEDLATDTARQMHRIQAFLGVEPLDLARLPDDAGNFHLIGNKMLHQFDGHIRLDETWRDRFSADEQNEILRRTSPLSIRWGYREGD